MATAPNRPPRPSTKGPIELVLIVLFSLLSVTLGSWFVGILVEIVGNHSLWRNAGAEHARRLVLQDMAHIAAAPRSLIVRDTVAWSQGLVALVEAPYRALDLLDAPALQPQRNPMAGAHASQPGASLRANLRRTMADMGQTLRLWAQISMYVAMDVLLRMSVAVFALPAFVLACLVGLTDGLVRRDLRRWGGGRESSFVYHHAKRYTAWSLTGGFGLYLAWPFGGFNPAYMVLVFTVLVAFSMSTTVAAFKKYV